MSAPGYTNLNTSVNYSLNATQNGGSAPPYQNGPAQSYPSTYPASGYGAPPQHYPSSTGHCVPASSKTPIMNNDYANYYSQHQPLLPPAAGAVTAPSSYGVPQGSLPPSQPYNTANPPASGAPLYPAAYQHPYTMPSAYYGQQYPVSQAQSQQPNLMAVSSGTNNGAPLYPIVSYPSAPGSSQYGTLRSSQAPMGPGPVSGPNVIVPPGQATGQSMSMGNGPIPPSSATPAHQGYGTATLCQQSATVNGQTNALQTQTMPHYDQNLHGHMTYSYGGVPPTTQGPDGDRPLSGTPATSVHSSPGHQPGLPYRYVTNSGVSSAPVAATTPAGQSSSSSEDEDDEDEDEEAGADSSSSTTGSASPVPNSYESLEGGSYTDPASIPPPGDLSRQAPFGYSYPAMQPNYIQTAPRSNPAPSATGYHAPGYQDMSQPFPSMSQLSAALGGLSAPELTVDSLRPVNLLQERNILPPTPTAPPEPNLSTDLKNVNCSPDTFRCTLTNIPQTQALLNKARLPLGLLLHPFRDLSLPVITSNTIVRCRSCRTYINPFVSFLDQRRWKCNLCYRVNDVPDEFMYNPVTRSYGEPHKRPEILNSTVEFIASSDYMLRPPQPAAYLFVLDVSHNAVEGGYLNVFCQSLLENLDKLPGDTRSRVGFLTFDSTIHFYNLQEGLSQPQMLVVSDIDDVFIPTADSLLVNLKESKELVKDLLNALPSMFTHTQETHSALGPALQAAYKLMSPTGGRVSVFQTQLPTLGAGTLQSREDPNQRSSTKGVKHLGPATDFYKKLALDCSGQQIAVDLFLLSSQYSDLASLACVSKYSAGSIFYYPTFHHVHNPAQRDKFQKDLQRYLTRKIGFEAVMRIRCTKGLSIHTFHGNFFVRSTDLLSLANVNPDSGFAVQMSIEESLADTSLACFQAALLYTSSKGKRRIRVHTLCLPVVSQLSDVFAGADVQAITCLLANMAIDRSISSSLTDARDALLNAVVDSLAAYRANGSNLQPAGLIAPASLQLFPLYVLALLKQKALRTGTSTRLDDRVFNMCDFKSQPLWHVMRMVHPDLYRIDSLSEQRALRLNDTVVPQPPRLQLTAEKLTRDGAFLMDCGNVLYLWVGKCCSEMFIQDVLGCPNYASIPPNMTQIPELENPDSEQLRTFLSWLQETRSFCPALYVVKDEASAKSGFFQHLVEDRTESAFSYYEFLLHIQQQMTK
ncbi:protein transport protein Sec24B isoform X2 [Clupea harengus]|uniref:Protein transport protein Sec24B isoform X2 n=1 Tax=Clupea harengus TaxID=7950 RepID=A0A6P8GYP7_CLUHA|nr:protein transport protein Sec24B isoform X2 [Clupea harengus]